MSRENTSHLPHGDGEGRCLASSPVCGSVVERGVARYPGPSVAAFFVPCGSACKQRGGNVPTMVLSETRGLWLCWVVRGGIRWPLRLGAPKPAQDTHPRTRALSCRWKIARDSAPAADHALKLLVASNVPRRTLLLSSRSSARWRRSCAPASAAPSPAAYCSSAAPGRTRETLHRTQRPRWPRP